MHSRRGAVLALVGGLTIAASGGRSRTETSEIDATLAELVAAAGAWRPVEGRLSGGLAFGPFDPGGSSRANAAGVAMAAARIEILAGRTPHPEAMRAMGILRLYERRPREAVEFLERAATLAPARADIQSDLSAALVESARATDGPRSYVRALETADRARLADATLPAGRYNRALALERLFLAEARDAWRQYLDVDGRSPWAHEARDHLAILERPSDAERWDSQSATLDAAARRGDATRLSEIARLFPRPAALHALEDLLGQWSEEQEAGRPRAAVLLGALRTLAAQDASVFGDSLLVDTLAAIEGARERSGRGALRTLTSGHRTFFEGLRSYRRYDAGPAARRFERAHQLLESQASPFAHWVAFRLACAEHLASRFRDAQRRLRAVLERIDGRRYPYLRAQTIRLLALETGLLGRPAEALGLCLRALDQARSLGDAELLAALNDQAEELFDSLGESQRAWSHRYTAWGALGMLGRSARRETILDRASRYLASAHHLSVALYFQNEWIAFVRRNDDPTGLAMALIRRSVLRGIEGRSDDALGDLGEARAAIARVPDQALRRRLEAESLLARAQTLAASRPQDAKAALDEAVAFFSSVSDPAFLVQARLTRGVVARREGLLAQAEVDLRAAIGHYRRTAPTLSDEGLRFSHAATWRRAFDELTSLLVDQGRLTEAFEIADAERLAAAGLPEEAIANSDAVRASLAEGTVLAAYTVLPDGVLVWVLDRSGQSARRLPSPVGDVARRVESLTEALRRGSEAPPAALDALLEDVYAMLLEPVMSDRRARALVVVPDDFLAAVPFAALRTPSGRYVVEDSTVVVAPAATLHLASASRDASTQGTPWRPVVVGDPAFDATVFPWLSRLEGAQEEARRVAEIHGAAVLLLGEEASRRRLLEAARGSALLHFAGHAQIAPERPQASLLVLARDPAAEGDDSGALYAGDLQEERLSGMRLAVLSACRTGGLGSPGRNTVGFVPFFLSAGVPNVVASLWNVDDRTTVAVMEAYHRALVAGADPAEALRRSQLSLLEASDRRLRSPAAWAAFEIFGGVAAPPSRQTSH